MHPGTIPYAIWAHSSTVIDGDPIGDTGLRLANYIVQPEDSGVGVFSHEYGHDLGLPDLYDVSGEAESDILYWDLMSAGSHTGPLLHTIPTHMGLWGKWVLRHAAQRGAHVVSGDDQDRADVRLSRRHDVPARADVRFWMSNDYMIEADWNYNAPGLLVWYRDTTYGTDNTPTANTLDPPSAGSKGGLPLVDSHFDPLRHRGETAEHYSDDHDDADNLESFPAELNVSDAAFTTWGTYAARDCFTDEGQSEEVYCTRYGRRRAVSRFTDALG